MIITRKLKKFSGLTCKQRRYFIEAYITLGLMRAAIAIIPFKRLVKSLDRQAETGEPALNKKQISTAQVIGEAVRTAANNTPWESACLVQALTAQRILRRKGIGGVFHLGARMDDTNDQQIHAHAWLVCDSHIITGDVGHEEYKVLTTFQWN